MINDKYFFFLISLQYKKFGSKKTIEARVLEIANHVDKVRLFLCNL